MTLEAGAIPQLPRNEPINPPRNLLGDAIAWLHLMEQEADQTQNPSLRHCLAYVSAIVAGTAHAQENDLSLSSLNRPFSRYYTEESLGDPDTTDLQQFGDILRIQFTASYIAQGWLENHPNSRAAKDVAQNPDAPFRRHRKLVYEIVAEVGPHLPTPVEGYLQKEGRKMLLTTAEIPSLVPGVLRHLYGMVHQEAIDFQTAQQIAKQEVDRAISEAEITEREAALLLEPWETSPSATPTISPEHARQLIQRFRKKLTTLAEG